MSLILEYHISEAVVALKKGHIVQFPSDTVWGLACALNNEKAINQLIKLQNKHPIRFHELLVSDEFMLKKFVNKIHPRVDTLLHFYQRPLTVVYNNTMNLPYNLLPERKKVGFRIVRNQFCQSVIHDLGTAMYFLPFYRMSQKNDSRTERKDTIDCVGHYVPEEFYDPLEVRESRVVSYDGKGQLIFYDH